MRSPIMRALLVLITLLAFSPVLASAQTPVVATPEPAPSFEITVLGLSVLSTESEATPVSATTTANGELVHALMNISIEPGAPVPTLTGMRSVLISVQQGSLLVSASGEAVRIDVGTGTSIRSGDDTQVLCERHDCVLDPGQEAMLGPGNGLSVSQGNVQMEVHGDGGAVVQLSLVLPGSLLNERCWICPTI